ncbi:MAG: MoaD/ThiS family protein [Desulfobacterales bacterium]|nr:MoaD/ThiS family protein [Deltaproteobacteria bacterium]NNK94055.1 MoaD/ThiS family protein [Desulfobacterales bacterium]
MTALNTSNQPTINLNLYATLSTYRPRNPSHYPIQSGMTLGELVEQLLIPSSTAVTVFVNGKTVAMDSQLRGNEEVKIFPLMGGG